MSVSFQALSSLSRGLFNRAIMQSGSATSGGMIQRKPLENFQGLARRVRCLDSGVSSSADFLNCLRNVSAEELMTASYTDRTLARSALDFLYTPTADGEFLPKHPVELLEETEYLRQIGFYERDYLSGCVNNDGGYFGNASLVLNPDFYDLDLVPLVVEGRFGKSSAPIEDVVKFFYTFPRYAGVRQLELKNVLDTPGDTLFYVPRVEFARAVARGQRSERRNLVYFFDHYPAYMGRSEVGMTHGLDIFYEFDMGLQAFINASLWTADDDHLSRAFISTIVGFVNTGNPATELQSYLQDPWADFDLRNESYLSIKPNSLTNRQHLRARAVSLWTDLIPDLLDPVSSQKNLTSTHIPTLSELVG